MNDSGVDVCDPTELRFGTVPNFYKPRDSSPPVKTAWSHAAESGVTKKFKFYHQTQQESEYNFHRLDDTDMQYKEVDEEEAVVPQIPTPHDQTSPFIQTASLPPEPLTPVSLSILCRESPSSLYSPLVTPPAEPPRTLLHLHHSDHMGFQGYTSETYLHRRKLEMKYHPSGSLKNQPQLNEGMRGLQVGAMIHLGHKLCLSLDTLFLAVNIFDRFLLTTKLSSDYLQLLAITAILIAGKQEEIFPPEIDILLRSTRSCYSRLQVKQMEKLILMRLKFELFVPSSLYFMEHYAANRVFMAGISHYSGDQARRTRCLARYLLEMALANYSLYQFPPSVLGLVSLEIADDILCHKTRLGSLFLCGHSQDTITQAQQEMKILKEYITANWNSTDLDIVFLKYSDKTRTGDEDNEKLDLSNCSMSDAF